MSATIFKPATKKKAKLRLAFEGVAGAGKTYSSLVLAKALGGRVALMDTEHGSASKYANLFTFDSFEPESFSPDVYVKAIQAAGEAGYDVLVIDSLSHEWMGTGGALELVDSYGAGGNKFTDGWGQVTPKHNRMVDAILAYPGHVIATLRQKAHYVIEKNEKGKSVPMRKGVEAVQRSGMDFEFDVVVELDTEGNVKVTKTRCPDLSDSAGMMKRAEVPRLAKVLKAWLSDGVENPRGAAVAPSMREPSPIGSGGKSVQPQPPASLTSVEEVQTEPGADIDPQYVSELPVPPELSPVASEVDWVAHVANGKTKTERYQLYRAVPDAAKAIHGKELSKLLSGVR